MAAASRRGMDRLVPLLELSRELADCAAGPIRSDAQVGQHRVKCIRPDVGAPEEQIIPHVDIEPSGPKRWVRQRVSQVAVVDLAPVLVLR
jgi:hypothetical protein